jgi:hypothetical protein
LHRGENHPAGPEMLNSVEARRGVLPKSFSDAALAGQLNLS